MYRAITERTIREIARKVYEEMQASGQTQNNNQSNQSSSQSNQNNGSNQNATN